MRMDLGLIQTIKQIQTLSPQMYMSMEILCLNSLDLEERIDKELEENIALELSDGVKAEGKEGSSGPAGEAEPEPGPAGQVGATLVAEPQETVDAFDRRVEQWDRYAREEYDYQIGPRAAYDGDKDEKLEALNNTAGRPMSLQEYLEQQVHLLGTETLGDDPEYMVDLCIAIIYNIDDRGYLMYPLEEISRSLIEEARADTESMTGSPAGGGGTVPSPPQSPRGGTVPRVDHAEKDGLHEHPWSRRVPTLEDLKKALGVVQSLDPPGIGGKDLKECLILQLKRDGQLYPLETQIIENHLDDLGQNRLPKIAKALGILVEEVKTAAETIASLNPIPGKLFGGEPPRFVKPDVIVEEVDGRYEVRVESEHLPRLQVSSYYRDLYRNAYKDPELKKFVKKKLESAEWLIAAIRQRQSTLQRIAKEIVGIQSGFLDHGISHLKPLKMVEVAERVGVHVSTISRAISAKYIQTPRGIFEMKFFFTGGAVKTDGTMEARGSVIQRIKEHIENEDKRNPLSDIDIVKKLEGSDIKLSRRTVTKYREAEGIPSSRQRRAY